jgi:tRNA(Ile)-lysidine synthase
MDLSAQVAACFHRYGQLHSTGVIAVSGGPDSVALAHLLVGLLKQGQFARLIVGHVNHQLRGTESDADECSVQQLPSLFGMSNDLRLTCRTTRIAVKGIAESERKNLEGIARRERYGWLAELARQEEATWIATGHSADDQAETVLFRLLRGSGVLGLSGMRECRALHGDIRLFRPLLAARRHAIGEYLRINNIPYRVDSSNQDRRFTRNRLRLELIPLMERDYNPAVVEVLCRLAGQAGALHAEIEIEARELLEKAELPRAGEILVFAIERLRSVSANRVREMFRLVWQRENWPMGEMDLERWNRLIEIVAGSLRACDFPGRIHARLVGGVVQLQCAPAQPS